jgi:putative membrane-bound dehydrogenase-like protein
MNRPSERGQLCPRDPSPLNSRTRLSALLLCAALFIPWILVVPTASAAFRAGALSVDISPTNFPVRVNAMFTERSADKVVDPLFAKALALDDGTTRLVICVVDTCMMPRNLIDRAKAEAGKATGIPADRMLVSATHTHSAPSAMGCLGSRVDPRYAAFLPGRITAAIVGSVERLAPARIGWAQADDWDHTFNRRWIRRPDKMLTDPFGQRNVRAHMHPGHESPDAIGPSGPVDPQLSVLSVQRADGRPLALLANYSMHYYESPLLSSDYFGRFAGHVATMLGADGSFVGIMSQGTSGDLMWMDYGAPRREIGYDAYAKELAGRVAEMVRGMKWLETAPLKMAERKLGLAYRVPDEQRLAWARDMAAKLGDKLPQSQPEIYALEATYLHERPRTELILQALRIGDLGITALPNEVFAITGLKLKRQSPLAATFNIELANGAEGYIPPPEQHKLGGYTTWPARTAGLETNAEPRIVETALALLEEVAARPRGAPADEHGSYARAVLEAKPAAYWRFEEIIIPTARDATGKHDATFEDGVALWLPGADGRIGHQPPQPPTPNAFSGAQINRSVHFAGGRVRAKVPLGENYSVELWLWNGLPADARAVAGYVFSRGSDGDKAARGEHLGIGGTFRGDLTGKLILFNGNERDEVLVGRTKLALRAWHHVVFVREGGKVRVHLDGRAEPEIAGAFAHTVPAGENSVFIGGRNDGLFNIEGKLDEVAVYPRALAAVEIAAHYQASALKPPAAAAAAPAPDSQPLSPLESMRKIHLSPGFGVELVASEPLVIDPVAIDWSPDGRLWVVEMADYPMGMDGKGKPGGRVRVLEDADGDGRYDKQTLFADGLSFPTGLLTWRDGVIVTAAPEIVFLRDTDGDGKADSREVLVSGLMQGNQQLRANGLRWGLDGWVYCAAGGHHRGHGAGNKIKSERTGNVVAVGALDFRFKPDTGELEPESGPSQFGRNRDDWGHWFGTQNSRPLWHYVLADRYLRRNPHVAAPDPTHQVVVPLNPKVWPVSSQEKRYHSFNEAGHFTSACAGMIYRDELLFGPAKVGQASSLPVDGASVPRRSGGRMPPEPADKMSALHSAVHAFTCEPFHNVVQRNVVVPDGVTFAAHREPGEERLDFFASEDRWCRPVMTRTGPDGALWVVDMYRYMIEHPDWLPENGRAELLPHYRLGDDKGRIYRMFSVGKPPRKPQRLDQLSTSELVAALDSPNEWQRDKAHMMLLWRADQSAVAPLAKLAADNANPLARLHALCVLDGLGALTGSQIVRGLGDLHSGVRENALRLAEKRSAAEIISAASKLVDDPNAKVRLQLALTLGEWTNSAAGVALGQLAVAHHDDSFMVAAVMSSAVPHKRALVDAAVRAGEPALSAWAEPLSTLLLELDDETSLHALLAPTLKADGGRFTAAQLNTFSRFMDTMARTKNSRIGSPEIVDALVEFAQRTARSETAATAERAAAASVLARIPAPRAETLRLLEGWLDPRQPAELQRAAIRAMAATADKSVPGTLLAAWPGSSPETRAAALETLLSREPWAFAALTHSTSNGTPAFDAARRSRLLQHSSKRVREAAGKLFNATAASGRAAVIEQFQPALKLAGDGTRGEAVFTRLCVVCHKRGGTGSEIGPDLISVAGHPPEKLLVNIVDPSADVQPGFHAYNCRLADGAEFFGLIAAETGNSVTFKLADATTRVVRRSDIAELRGGSVSLMPEGLEAGSSHQDMADLIGFLRAGATKAQTAGKAVADVRVGAAAVNLESDESMPLAGYLENRFTKEQEGELRAVAVVVEKPGGAKVAIVACDVLWVTRAIVDAAAAEIERTIGIPASHLLVNATHTHHAPGVAPAHAFGWSEKFGGEVRRGIVKSVQDAHARLADAAFLFKLGEERTVGANSRLLLRDGNISWLNPMGEAGDFVQPTAPFDPQLPVLDFRSAEGKTLALIFNHSTHTIGTRSGRDARSASFYGLAAQDLERELGGVVSFLEGASGSTHNVRGVPVPVAIERLKRAVLDARAHAEPRPVARVAALKRPFTYRVRNFDEAVEAAKVDRYTTAHAKSSVKAIGAIFANARRELAPKQGEERTTWLQVILIGDVAIVGVPAEYFTALGLDIKRRSPFPNTYVAELANDWLGYLPDRDGHRLGGYQTWTGLHSYAEPGTGERVADEAVKMLEELARGR